MGNGETPHGSYHRRNRCLVHYVCLRHLASGKKGGGMVDNTKPREPFVFDERSELSPEEAKKFKQIFTEIGERFFEAYSAGVAVELVQFRADNEALKRQLADLLCWAKAAYPSVAFTAEMYGWPMAKALLENAPDGVRPGD